MSQHLSMQKKEQYRKALLRKGHEIAIKLSAVLAGKEVRLIELADLRQRGPVLTPEQKLRRYLDLVNERRKALESEDGSYGVCEVCKEPLSEAELDMMAWATRCRGCSGKQLIAGR